MEIECKQKPLYRGTTRAHFENQRDSSGSYFGIFSGNSPSGTITSFSEKPFFAIDIANRRSREVSDSDMRYSLGWDGHINNGVVPLLLKLKSYDVSCTRPGLDPWEVEVLYPISLEDIEVVGNFDALRRNLREYVNLTGDCNVMKIIDSSDSLDTSDVVSLFYKQVA